MVKKLKLEVKYVPENEVLGLFSGLSDYRLCWFINNSLGLKLSRTTDIALNPFKSEAPELFSLFIYRDKELMVDYYLLNNRKDHHLLLPEPKKLDYLLLLKAKDVRVNIDETIAKLRKVPQIVTAVWFKQTEKVKNLDRLLYDFEIALIDKPQ